MTRNPNISEYLARRHAIESWRAEEERPRPMVVRAAGRLLVLDNEVPLIRSECPTAYTAEGVRICGHLKCSMHLWRIDGADRPGRRGRTPIPTTLRAAWMESPMPPCCALDLADKGGMAARDIAAVMDKDATLIRMIVRAGAKKLKRKSEEDDE